MSKQQKRDHMAGIIVGRKATGKSTEANEVAEAYAKAHPDKKVLIIDVNGAPAYAHHKELTYELFPRWQKGIYRFYDSDHKKLFAFVCKHFRDGLIIFEDCTKYIPANPDGQIKTILVDHRMWGADLLFTFHSLSYIPKFFWKMTAYIIIKKTQDDYEEIKKRKIPNGTAVLTTWLRVMKAKSNYHSETVATLI